MVKVKRAVARELCTPGLTRNLKYLAKCKGMYLCGHAPWCGACPHMECGHAPCISQQEITSRGILLSAYIWTPTIIILLLCVLVWFMTYLRVIYGIDMKIEHNAIFDIQK